MAIIRLQEVRSDSNSYAGKFTDYISTGTPMVGNAADVNEVHTKIVQPYIDRLCKNIEKRFGDSASRISVAASLFNARKYDELDLRISKPLLLSSNWTLKLHSPSGHAIATT